MRARQAEEAARKRNGALPLCQYQRVSIPRRGMGGTQNAVHDKRCGKYQRQQNVLRRNEIENIAA